jgi:SAM-dependent methyltransferase
MTARAAPSRAAIWHDLECGAYAEDLALWRALAHETGGPVLDVGAGTGRVSLALAADGLEVVALDVDASLLEVLAARGAGLPVATVAADARRFALGHRVRLVLVPMQTLQLLGGAEGRLAFLRAAHDHLERGGLLAAALADAMDCFDDEHDLLPPPDTCELDGVRYASHLVDVVDEGGRAALHRIREVAGRDGRHDFEEDVVRLDRITAEDVAAEAGEAGFAREPDRHVPGTETWLGSTVVVLRKP